MFLYPEGKIAEKNSLKECVFCFSHCHCTQLYGWNGRVRDSGFMYFRVMFLFMFFFLLGHNFSILVNNYFGTTTL